MGRRPGVPRIDLDGFGRVDDTRGHPAGDAVPRGVLARPSSCLRERDVVARTGRDELVVVIDDGAGPVTAAPPRDVAARVPTAAGGVPCRVPSGSGSGSAAVAAAGRGVGGAPRPDDGGPGDVVRRVAGAPHAAGKAGRNRFAPRHVAEAARPVAA